MLSCTFENGAKTSLRHVVVDAIIIDKNKILLIKRAPHLINGNKYAFPGGFLDRDETIEQAVVREALEETGYEVKIEKLFSIRDNPGRPQEDRQNIAFMYITHPIKQVDEADKEVSELKWLDLDNLPPAEEFAFDHFQTLQEYKKVHKA